MELSSNCAAPTLPSLWMVPLQCGSAMVTAEGIMKGFLEEAVTGWSVWPFSSREITMNFHQLICNRDNSSHFTAILGGDKKIHMCSTLCQIHPSFPFSFLPPLFKHSLSFDRVSHTLPALYTHWWTKDLFAFVKLSLKWDYSITNYSRQWQEEGGPRRRIGVSKSKEKASQTSRAFSRVRKDIIEFFPVFVAVSAKAATASQGLEQSGK